VFEAVDQALAKMPLGTAQLQAPDRLEYDRTGVVRLVLSLGKPVGDLQRQLEEISKSQPLTVRVAPRMNAHLTGSAFEIQAITPEPQAVSKAADTEWEWEVAGKRPGPRELHVTLSVPISVEGQEELRAVRTFDATIVVEGVPLRQRITTFVSEKWQWFFTVLIIPVALFLWRVVKRRRQGPPPEYGWPPESSN
jgi:hypothetical protein